MEQTISDTGPAMIELDERQRAAANAASRKALRVTMLALLAAMVGLQLYTEDVVPAMIVAAVGFIALAADSYYLRKAGVEREIEQLQFLRRAREGLLNAQSVRMFVYLALINLAPMVADGTLELSRIPMLAGMAALGAISISWIEWRWAGAEARKAESDEADPAFERGRAIGRRIARLFRR